MTSRQQSLLILFGIAVGLRLILFLAYTPPLVGDAKEYYYNSQTLENTVRHFPYDQWYQRTPAYMAFLHVTGQSLLL
jgi:hypothetical protein